MFFIFIFGTRFVTRGSASSGQRLRCEHCGTVGEFLSKTGRRFITFFFIPVIPAGGVKHLLECPTCGTSYQAAQ